MIVSEYFFCLRSLYVDIKRLHAPNHLPDKLLLGRLVSGKEAQTRQQPPLALGVDGQLGLLVHVHQQHAQVAAAAALPGGQQALPHAREDVDGGRVALRLDVAGGHDARLLLRLVEVLLGYAVL